MPKVTPSFYMQDDVVSVAKQLLGKTLVTRLGGKLTSARITETEAYCGATDRACHAFQNKKTKRTEIMFGPGGHAYVYLCYGIHHLFNIVTNKESFADAVLIRAAEPLEGLPIMFERRGYSELKTKLTTGPGSLSKAMGITTKNNGSILWGDEIWLEDAPELKPDNVLETTRIGVAYAGDDALLPWRFCKSDSVFVTKG
jgi:DNA-3-methyladenine glycosylase